MSVSLPELQMSKHNHFQFGYNDKVLIDRKAHTDKYFVRFGQCERPVMDWKSECISAAQEIAASTSKEIVIVMSGGLDSEIVAESFRLAQIPFKIIIGKFKNDLNLHDISWAITYCEKHTIQYEFYEIDILEFYKSTELINYMKLTNCPYPMILTQIKILDYANLRNQFTVMGCYNPFFKKYSNKWYFYSLESVNSLCRFQYKKKIEAQIGFFIWRPEQLLTFANDPIVQDIFLNKIEVVDNNSENIKYEIYSKYFDIIERKKYKGYEKFEEIHKNRTAELVKLLGGSYNQVQTFTMQNILQLEFKP